MIRNKTEKRSGLLETKGMLLKRKQKICTDKRDDLPNNLHSLFNNSKKLKEAVEFGTHSDHSTGMSQIMMG